VGERDLGTTIANSLMSELRIPRNLKATIAAVTFALLAISAVADKPRTVDESVQLLKAKWLQPKDRDWILHNPRGWF